MPGVFLAKLTLNLLLQLVVMHLTWLECPMMQGRQKHVLDLLTQTLWLKHHLSLQCSLLNLAMIRKSKITRRIQMSPSSLQIETLSYACKVPFLLSYLIVAFVILVYACVWCWMLVVWQRHHQHLPNSARAGNGAGVGKGQTIAGLIWENWHHGRRKSL